MLVVGWGDCECLRFCILVILMAEVVVFRVCAGRVCIRLRWKLLGRLVGLDE